MYTAGEMDISRRCLLGLAAAAPFAAADSAPAVKLGIDLFSLRSQNWTPFQLLDYCAAQKAKVVHFSEIRFIGSLEPDNLRAVRRHAEELGIQVEIGMRSICPTSKMFDAKAGTAEEQISRMLDAAKLVGSQIVRAVLGSSEDRRGGQLEKHIESTVRCCAVCARAGCKPEDDREPPGDMRRPRTQAADRSAGREFPARASIPTARHGRSRTRTSHSIRFTHTCSRVTRDSAVWRVRGSGRGVGAHGEGDMDIDGIAKACRALPEARALAGIDRHRSTCFAFHDEVLDDYRDIPRGVRAFRDADRGQSARRCAPPRSERRAAEREDLNQYRAHAKALNL
jgi:hypothetical protein